MNRSICLQANNIDTPFKLHSEGTLSGVCFKMTSLMKNQSLFSIFKCNIFLVKNRYLPMFSSRNVNYIHVLKYNSSSSWFSRFPQSYLFLIVTLLMEYSSVKSTSISFDMFFFHQIENAMHGATTVTMNSFNVCWSVHLPLH